MYCYFFPLSINRSKLFEFFFLPLKTEFYVDLLWTGEELCWRMGEGCDPACLAHRVAYIPPAATKSSCLPTSTTAPLSITTILSALRIVLRR